MSKADDTFVKQFGAVLILLFLFTIAMVVLARSIGEPAMDRVRNSPSAVAERVARVGSVRMEGDAMPVAAEPAAPAPAGVRGGEEVYNLACIACHATGAADAPIVGDAAAWEPRVEQGLEALVGHAINGKNAMPARGGNPGLGDEEVRNAVTWMLEETGIDLGGEAAATEPAAAVAAAAPVAAETAPAAAETAPAAEQVAAVDGQPGEEVYNSICLACHMTGAANAPKLGDEAQWKLRMQGGLDLLVANAINGKGVMPARGGNPSLADADVHNAVVYILENSGITL